MTFKKFKVINVSCDRDVETKDKGETMLDSMTGSLILTRTASRSKGGTGTGSSDRCMAELG